MTFNEIIKHIDKELSGLYELKDEKEVLFVSSDNLLKIVNFLNNDSDMMFDILLSISGYDNKDTLGSAYNLFSLEKRHYIEIRVEVERDNPSIPSVVGIWKAADWHERESYDLFGIQYENHPDLRRILLPSDWIGYPLRKDFVTPEFYNGLPVPKDKRGEIPFSTDDKTDRPISLYGATKKANELMATSYSKLYGLNTTGLRYFTVYGPWGRPDMALFIFTDKILKGESIPVYNHGNMKRDFTYIDDIIMGTRSAMENNYPCEVFNLGNHKSEKLMDMIGVIEECLGERAEIDFQPMQKGDVKESFADIKYSKKMLSFVPNTPISKGIPLFINWYKNNLL